MKISIICVYNNKEQLETCLLSSLKRQNVDYELVLVDGSNGKFSSCAAALNYGVTKSHGEILVFSHQDIYLKTECALAKFVDFIEKTGNNTIVGAAGTIEKNKYNIGNYTTGIKINNEIIKKIDKPQRVSCIDECFFGMKRSTYEGHPFDEVLCDAWDLYAVDQCLYQRSRGGQVYLFPCQIHHMSNGKISLKYMNVMVKMVDKYFKNFKYIWTTCYKVPANRFFVRVLRWVWKMNRIIRRKGL